MKTSEFTRRMCEGKRVQLEGEWQKSDKYGRILAYVFVLETGKEIFLNEKIIKQGYCHTYLKTSSKTSI